MSDTFAIPSTPIAVVGVGAIMPEAPDADAFWANITGGRYSITDVPTDRWDPALYFSPDHAEPDKTYSTIGGWVREYPWDPIRWKLPVPPKVADQMDDGQRWAISAARSALIDAGWPDWTVDPDNVAVIIGNAIGGEKHYETNMRIELPEVLRELEHAESFAALPAEQRAHIIDETRSHFLAHYGEINEDTMPGELANVIAGRVANLFNFRGPNFTTDAACASGLAAMSVAVEGLVDHRFDAALTGGIDHNMGVAAFVKFCKIGALSATGTRPFDAGADGFVMGEGAALFVLKRLEDAERDGDKIYAVILGIAGSSDGKGKGITAPNPIGQRLAVQRAWEVARRGPGDGVGGRGARHVDPRRRRDRADEPHRSVRRGRCADPWRGAGLGEVQHRAPQGGRRRGGHLQDGAQPRREGADAQSELQRAEPERRLGSVPVRRQHRIARLADAAERCPSRGRERFRFRWHQLPCRARGARSGPSQAAASGVRRRSRLPGRHDGRDTERRVLRPEQAAAAGSARARWARRR